LFAQKGENIAITGTTDYDSSDAALAAIMAEWTSKHSYAERVANLSGTGTADRLNGNYFLIAGGPDATVHGDGRVNRVFGGSGGNWYFAQLSGLVGDLLEGKRHGEVVEDIGSEQRESGTNTGQSCIRPRGTIVLRFLSGG
jgi:hypothetical protein